MRQPFLGLVASAVGIALALLFVSLFSVPSFLGPVAFYLLCSIPFQVMAVVMWGANPSFVAKRSQPTKGLVLLIVTLVAGAKVAGTALLVAAYLLAWVIFRTFFDYAFMQGTPVYLASAPDGMFHAVSSVVFIVTALAAMFLILSFDLWPFTLAPSVMQQPTLGLIWTIAVLLMAWLAMFVGVTAMGIDPMAFLVNVTVPFVFGSIVVLNMFQNSLAGSTVQPVRGIVNTLLVVVIGQALAAFYRIASPRLAGPLTPGPPGYDFEVWTANALLSVTFPFLIFLAAYFAFWPLAART